MRDANPYTNLVDYVSFSCILSILSGRMIYLPSCCKITEQVTGRVVVE